MSRRTTRRGSQRRGLATFLLVTFGVIALTFVGSIMGTAGGMFAAYTYFASDLPDPNILEPWELFIYAPCALRLAPCALRLEPCA